MRVVPAPGGRGARRAARVAVDSGKARAAARRAWSGRRAAREAAVRLGIYTRDFYRSQQAELGIDSGLVEQGYFMPAYSPEEVAVGRARVAMQQRLGLAVEWLEGDEVERRNPTLAKGVQLGASYCATDGYIDPPTNVRAYTAALFTSGVDVRERTAFTGLRTSGGRVVGVDTSAGPIDAPRVVLTGGPTLGDVGDLAGFRFLPRPYVTRSS